MPVMQKKSVATGRAWIELNMENLRYNAAILRALLPPGCELMPAVKADAYGHGAAIVAGELNRLGVRAFCVASLGEGIELRKSGIQGVILILGYTHPEQVALLRQYDLTQTVIDYAYAQMLNEYGRPVRVHVGVDTGMHRLGERCEQIDRIAAIFRMENLRVDGIFTHLCAGDSKNVRDQAFTTEQGRAFYHVVGQLRALGLPCPKAHILGSYGLLNHPELGGDYARAGIALYGVLSTRADLEQCRFALRPVLSVRARVACVRPLHTGEFAGYGFAFSAGKEMKIAALAIGYADGLPRALSCGGGCVLLHGRMAPVVGRICMDQTLVNITDIPDVGTGDIATVIGTSGSQTIGVCDIAEQSGTIANEVLSRLGPRLRRIPVHA